MPDLRFLQQQEVPSCKITIFPYSPLPPVLEIPLYDTRMYLGRFCIELAIDSANKWDPIELRYDDKINRNQYTSAALTIHHPVEALELGDVLGCAAQQSFRKTCQMGSTIQAVLDYVDCEDGRAITVRARVTERRLAANLEVMLTLYAQVQPLMIDAMSMRPCRAGEQSAFGRMEQRFRYLWGKGMITRALVGLVQSQKAHTAFISRDRCILHVASCIIDAQILKAESK